MAYNVSVMVELEAQKDKHDENLVEQGFFYWVLRQIYRDITMDNYKEIRIRICILDTNLPIHLHNVAQNAKEKENPYRNFHRVIPNTDNTGHMDNKDQLGNMGNKDHMDIDEPYLQTNPLAVIHKE